MSWGFVAAGAATVVGGVIQERGNERALRSAERSGDQAIQFQRELLQTSIDLSRPQLEVANSALGALASIFGLQQPSQIDFDNLGSGGPSHPVYGDGNKPLNADELSQAYRDVLGREPDQGGLDFYLTRGPRDGSSRRSFTFNEFLDATVGSDEYRERTSNGSLQPFDREAVFSQPAAAQTATAGPDLDALVANNPLIKFNREQGEQAIARGAAARGLNQSGATLQDLSRFNQDLSSTGIQQFALNPLFQLAGFGTQASSQLNQTNSSVSDNLSNIAIGRGAARSSAFQNRANNIQNTTNNLFGLFDQFQRGGG